MIKKCETVNFNNEMTVALCDDERVQIGTRHIDTDGYAYINCVNDKYYISTQAKFLEQEAEKKDKPIRGVRKSAIALDKEE